MSTSTNPWLHVQAAGAGVPAVRAGEVSDPPANPYTRDTPATSGRTGLGLVVPVLAAHGGAGASVCSLVMADAAATEGLRVLLVDASDPARSGLGFACDREGAVLVGTGGRRGVRLGRRRDIDVRRVAAGQVELCSPTAVPDLAAWTQRLPSPYDVTIVDVGWDSWQLLAGPKSPAAAWLTGQVAPVVVLRATRYGLAQLEGILAAAEAAAVSWGAAPVEALVRVGADSWPAEFLAAANSRAHGLLTEAFTMPWDRPLERSGITTGPTPHLLQASATRILAGVGAGVPVADLTPTTYRRFIRSRGNRST